MNRSAWGIALGFVLALTACAPAPAGSDGSMTGDGTSGSTDASRGDATRADAANADVADADAAVCTSLEIVTCFARWYTADRVGITSTNCVAPSQPCGDGCCDGTCVNIAEYPSGMGGGAAPYACFPRGISECPVDVSNPNSGLASRVGCPNNSRCSEDGCCPIGQTCGVCTAPYVPADPCQCAVHGQEFCDGRDNDCNGLTDDGPDSCGPMNMCVAGACACRPEFLCGMTCTDKMSDRMNCGACGNVCPGLEICNQGTCGCGAGEMLCGTRCVLSATDPQNCGACGNVCPSVAFCNNGTCACGGPGETLCGSQCVFEQTDPSNCGACGRVCAGSAQCDQGVCVTPPPRPIAPLSSTTVASPTPMLRWALARSGSSAHVEICRDAACANAEQAFDSSATAAQPTQPLAPGVHYWRLRTVGGTQFAATWEFFVGRSNASPNLARTLGGDINGDGFADVVVPSFSSAGIPEVHVHYGAPGGVSTTVQALADATHPDMYENGIIAGDVNGDGFADVVTLGATGYLHLGGPTGAAGTPTTFAAFAGPLAALGDVNGDGYADVLVASEVYYGGPGGLTDARISVGGTAGDVNGDGFGDAEVINNGADLFLGGTTGLVQTGSHRFDVTVMNPIGDVNGDGYEDAADSTGTGTAFVYYSTSVGWGLTPNTISTTESSFGSAAVGPGDVDGDGYDDAVFAAVRSNTVTLFRGSATGVDNTRRATTSGPSGVASFGDSLRSVGDVNGDGHADLVVSTSSFASFLYLGTATGLGPNPIAL